MELAAAQIVMAEIQISQIRIQANALKQLTGAKRGKLTVLKIESLQMALVVMKDFTDPAKPCIAKLIVTQVELEKISVGV